MSLHLHTLGKAEISLASQPAATAAPDDRLPTFTEVVAFDAATAWDRLTPARRRIIGVLAVELAVVGARLNYQHDYTADQTREIEYRSDVALNDFNEKIEPLWADLYGWRSN